MLPDFKSGHFLAQMAQMDRIVLNSYLFSIAALTDGLTVKFYRSQEEAGTSVRHFPTKLDKPAFMSITGGGKRVNFIATVSETSNYLTRMVTREKSALKARLSGAGVRVPFGGAASASDLMVLRAIRQAKIDRLSVKPVSGTASRGVFLNQTLEQAEQIVMVNPQATFIVEQMILGGELRITASRTDVVAAQMIIPAHVVGDGESTLEQLLLRDRAARKQNPAFMNRLPDPAKLLKSVLAHGLRGDTVLEKGKLFRLSLDGLPTRAHRVPVLDRITPAIAQIAKDTVKAIDGTICGIDIMVDRAGVPFVIDVDANSGMWFECFPYPNGEWNLDVPEYILRHHFPKHSAPKRQVLSYDFAALKAELLREGRTSKGVNAADFATFA